MGVAFEICLGVVCVVLTLPAHGGETQITPGAMLPGGNHGHSSTLVLDGMFGASFDDTASGSIHALRGGEAGQLYEPMGIVAVAATPILPETSSCQLSAISTNDDGSATGIRATWTVLDGPIVAIDSNGVALAGAVYQDSEALAAATSLGLTGTVSLAVLDTLKDNYRLYAGDDIADAWQVDFFGVDNTNGLASADGDLDGANNFAEFIAGTSPLNGLDFFSIRSLRRQSPNQVELVLAPAFSNRQYHIEGATNLLYAGWSPLVSSSGPTQTTQLVIADVPSTNTVMFYRASIDYEW